MIFSPLFLLIALATATYPLPEDGIRVSRLPPRAHPIISPDGIEPMAMVILQAPEKLSDAQSDSTLLSIWIVVVCVVLLLLLLVALGCCVKVACRDTAVAATKNSLAELKSRLIDPNPAVRALAIKELVDLVVKSEEDEKKRACLDGIDIFLADYLSNVASVQQPTDFAVFMADVVAVDCVFLRDIALTVLGKYVNSMGEETEECLRDVATLLCKCMRTPGLRRSNAMLAMVDVLDFIDEDKKQKIATADVLRLIVENAAKGGESSDLSQQQWSSFQCLKQLAQQHPDLVKPYYAAISALCQKIGSYPDGSEEANERRSQAVELSAILAVM